MTAELDYAFTFQADLSLEDNNENTKELSTNQIEEPKKPTYFISSDKSKLYVLVYERESDSDESLPDDLQTFNDFDISNSQQAFNALNEYIRQPSRRYTAEELANNKNYVQGAFDAFYKTLIGLEKQYIGDINFNDDESITVKLHNERSNFYWDIPENTNPENADIYYDQKSGILTLKNLRLFSETKLVLETLQTDIQDYIDELARRYTLQEFTDQMGDETLRIEILKSVGLPPPAKPTPPDNTEGDGTEGDNSSTEEGNSSFKAEELDTSKINNMFMNGKNLIIEFNCDTDEKFGPKDPNYDQEKYDFNVVQNRLTVKGLNYFTEYVISNNKQTRDALDKYIVDTQRQYTVDEFSEQVNGETTQQSIKDLITKTLNVKDANGSKATKPSLIKELVFNKDTDNTGELQIVFDDTYNKFKLDSREIDPVTGTPNDQQDPIETADNGQISLNKNTSRLTIKLNFFTEDDTINELQTDVQGVIDDNNKQYTITEFEDGVLAAGGNDELRNRLIELITNKYQPISHNPNVTNLEFDKDLNLLTFQITIPKYKKFPTSGNNIKYELLKNNDVTDEAIYKVTIENLQFWFDFDISVDNLINAKNKVSEFIDYYGICPSDDPAEDNYKEKEEEIFDIFGETKLENGEPLSNFMIYDEQNFKLENESEFVINLSTKINERKLRHFVPRDITSDNIKLDEQTKILSFGKIAFSSAKAFFTFNEKERQVTGVNERGRNQVNLKMPNGYQRISSETITLSDGKKYKGWQSLTKLENFYMSDAVERIEMPNQHYFLYSCPELTHVQISKNLNYLNPYPFANSKKISNIDWNGNKALTSLEYATRMLQNGHNIKELLLPRNITKMGSSLSELYSYTQARNFKLFISWANDWYKGNAMFSNCNTLEAIVLLADDFIFQKYSGSYRGNETFANIYESNKKLIWYVKSEEVKSKLLSDPYGFANVSWLDPKRIVAVDDLENKLIEAGKIPSDW